eukprot:TRINITY_DN1430_c0_g1_i1.p2 TRINITY_DN1430_c0_g1~~TRINITY_DN1430_c0_g1_i1.p2  ORF type:complete len:171 (+),score=34.11 TRINITY_DN1430_c0_g1_i1:95-607(+)
MDGQELEEFTTGSSKAKKKKLEHWRATRKDSEGGSESDDSTEDNVTDKQKKKKKKVKRLQKFPVLLPIITVFDILIFIAELIYNPGFADPEENPLLGPDMETLLDFGAKAYYEIVDDYQLWRFFTPIFLHAGVIHIVMNMIFQLQVSLNAYHQLTSLILYHFTTNYSVGD